MSTTKKPRRKYRPRPVASWLQSSLRMDIEIMGFFMADKLARAEFDEVDSNTAAYMLNMCHWLATEAGNDDITAVCDRAIEAYIGIRKRRDRTGQYGATGDELVTLRETMPDIARYFTTVSQHRLAQARAYVLRVNEKMRAAGVVYAEPTRDGRLENCVRAG